MLNNSKYGYSSTGLDQETPCLPEGVSSLERLDPLSKRSEILRPDAQSLRQYRAGKCAMQIMRKYLGNNSRSS
jgi:hypothetical protein